MPYGDNQLSPTGLARLKQATQPTRPGYISAANRRLIQEGVNVGGGYIEINGNVLVDEPSQNFQLSDAGKAYLAWEGTNPELARMEAAQAAHRANQRELVARAAAENNLQLLQKERARGVMGESEYLKKQQEIVQGFYSAKAPSPIDYLTTAEDKDDPVMEQTRWNQNLTDTATEVFGDEFTPAMGKAIAGLTTRDKDGVLQNKFAEQLLGDFMKQRLAATQSRNQQYTTQRKSIEDNFARFEEPTNEQYRAKALRINQLNAQYGLPAEDVPEMQERSSWWGGTSQAAQSVEDMFKLDSQGNLEGGSAPQPSQIFAQPAQTPVRVKTNADAERAKAEARRNGYKTFQVIDKHGNTHTLPVN